jgi:hypothetical protein
VQREATLALHVLQHLIRLVHHFLGIPLTWKTLHLTHRKIEAQPVPHSLTRHSLEWRLEHCFHDVARVSLQEHLLAEEALVAY